MSGHRAGDEAWSGPMVSAEHWGYYFRPVVFGRVTEQMHIDREEIFGAVLAV